MAVKSLLKSQVLLKTIFNNSSKYEILFVANVRHISNTSQQTQMTSTYNTSKIQTIKSTNLPKNMLLRHCSPSSAITLMDGMIDTVPMTAFRRPLTLIFAWMLAKDKHLEKYRQMWFRRGFDVLTVKTTPFDLLLPPIGGRLVAKSLAKTLSELNSQYNEIVIHAFSVGGYQCGETLNELRTHEEYGDVVASIKGMVMDSMVWTKDCAPGLSRAVTQHPIVQPMLENSIWFFTKLFHNISVKNYLTAEKMMCNPLAKYSGLILFSKDDVVSSVDSNERLPEMWAKHGNRVQSKCWSKSTHVLHYREHQKEYEQELDAFIKSLKLKNSRI